MNEPDAVERSRPVYLVLLTLTVVAGLASRIYRGSIPLVLDRYAGDTLWATAVLLLLGLLYPRARTRSLALAAAAISLAVECSQLAHPAWLDALRRVPGVALVLGYDFVWIDLVCYAAGVVLGSVLDAIAFRGIRRAFGLRTAALAAGATAFLGAIAFTQLPVIGAGGLLHPARRAMLATAPEGCREQRLAGEGVELAAWMCHAIGPSRGTIVYLHGIADNRSSAVGAIERFRGRGFDVIAYDSRGHGQSGGEMCTYGFYEKRDLASVISKVGHGPIVLIGTSLGGSVALQHAGESSSIDAIVAIEAFSDLRTVARERAPFFFTDGTIEKAFALAEERARFDVDVVSPLEAATRIQVPVLMIHGANDLETPADHSRRIFEALAGPKELVIVPGVGHNRSLTSEVWDRIERWLEVHIPQ